MKYLFALTVLLIGFSQVPAQKSKPPADLVITQTLGGTTQWGSYYTYTIGADGRVTLDDRSRHLPAGPSFSSILHPPKAPKRAKRLSNNQLFALVREFEDSGFFEMREQYSYGDPFLTQRTCINHAAEKSLSFTANGRKKSVSFFLGCSFSDKSPLKAFLALYDKVSKVLSTVEAKAATPDPVANGDKPIKPRE